MEIYPAQRDEVVAVIYVSLCRASVEEGRLGKQDFAKPADVSSRRDTCCGLVSNTDAFIAVDEDGAIRRDRRLRRRRHRRTDRYTASRTVNALLPRKNGNWPSADRSIPPRPLSRIKVHTR